MKTIILLLAFCWPSLFFAQSPNTSHFVKLLYQGEQLLDKHPDSILESYALQLQSLMRPDADYTVKGRVYLLTGHAYFKTGQPEEAEPLLRDALAMFRKDGNDSLTTSALIVLGAAMGAREYPDLDSALLNLTEARDLATRRCDTLQLAKAYINIANVWSLRGDDKKALIFNYLCEELLQNQPYDLQKGHNFYGIGDRMLNLYMLEGGTEKLSDTRRYLHKAADVFNRLGEKNLEAQTRNALGAAALYAEQFAESKSQLAQSLEAYESLQDSTGMLNVYYNLATLAETQDKPDEAIKALDNLASLLKVVGDASDEQFMTRYFTGKKGKLSVILVENKKSNLAVIEKNRRITLVMWVSLAALVFILAGGYFWHRQRMRTKRAETDNLLKNQEIEFVRARLTGEEQGREKLARHIHDGIGGLLVSARWNLERALSELPGKEERVFTRIQENIRLQDESYEKLRGVLYQLEHEPLPWWEDIRKFCENLSNTQQTRIELYLYNLDESAGGEIGREARLITQELITNAFKHARARDISVHIGRIDRFLNIVVEDNGAGFDPTAVKPGMGLNSVEKRVAELNGSYLLDSGKKTGTTVFIDIPLALTEAMEDNPLLYASPN